MPKLKQINKTESILNHLRRYGSIDRLTAIQLYKCYDLPDVMKRIKRRGLKVENLKGYEPNTKYQLSELTIDQNGSN